MSLHLIDEVGGDSSWVGGQKNGAEHVGGGKVQEKTDVRKVVSSLRGM